MVPRNNIEGKVLLITHDSCVDGLGVVMAVKEYCELTGGIELVIHYAQYGDDYIPDVTGYNVIMGDFSYSRDILTDMKRKALSLVVIDHHESAEYELAGLDYCIFDMKKSGAVMVWEYLFPNERVPMILQHIQDRDIWTWKLPNTKVISAGLSLLTKADATLRHAELINDSYVKSLLTTGESILKYQDKHILKVVTGNAIKHVRWNGHTVPMVNTTTLISEIGNTLAMEAPFSIMYFITSTTLVLSFRSTTAGVDLLSLGIPKGHRNSAGWNIPLEHISIDKMHTAENLASYLKYANAKYLLSKERGLYKWFKYAYLAFMHHIVEGVNYER